MLSFLILICVFSTTFADFAQECLDMHNKYRKKHLAPPLKLDKEIQNYASERAKNLSSTGILEPSNNEKYGENIHVSFGKGVSAERALNGWYSEIENYNFDKPNSSAAFHFTQMVWVDSKLMGCSYAEKAENVYVVAIYAPPGNKVGSYLDNVVSSGGRNLMNRYLFLLIALRLLNG